MADRFSRFNEDRDFQVTAAPRERAGPDSSPGGRGPLQAGAGLPPPPPPAPSSSRPAGLCVRARRRVTTQRRERGGPGRAVKVTRGRGAAAGGLVTAVGRGESVPADGTAEGSPPLR